MCVLISFVKVCFCDKVSSHWVHWCGFSSVCLFRWCLKLLWFIKAFITLNLLIWLLPSVHSHIFFKITFLCETPITLVALILFLPSVWYDMFYKSLLLWESLITLGALMCLLLSVFLQMMFEDIMICKSLYHIDCIDMVSHQCAFSHVLFLL